MRTPLIVGQVQKAELAALRERARAFPFNVLDIVEQCKTDAGTARHLQAMQSFTIQIPTAFSVTFSYESGHPAGLVRHLSMSSDKHGRTPTPQTVWLIAKELGFSGTYKECAVWLEPIGLGDMAVNVVQPVPS